MEAVHLPAGWDTAILIAPFFGLLAFWMFGLDERVAAPRERSARRRFCHTDPNGQSVFCDPDGRTAKTRHATPLTRPNAGKPSLVSPLKDPFSGQQVLGYLPENRMDTSAPSESVAAREFH
jgi:hypothetical protein